MFPILSILHVCVEDWGSDYVLKPSKEFDPLPPGGAVAPHHHGGVEEASVSVVMLLRVRCIVLGVLGRERSKLSRG